MSTLQESFHQALSEYIEEISVERSTTGNEIPYPVLIVFLGDRIREELDEYILPEMKKHWPGSFSHTGNGRLIICSIDRKDDSPDPNLDNCFHLKMTQEPLSSLESDLPLCKEINSVIRSSKNLLNKYDLELSRLRIILATSVEDKDSLIAGDILAIMKKFSEKVLRQDNIRNTRLFAFLPDDFYQEEEFDQTTNFFLKWMDWKNRNLPQEKCPKVYNRFGDTFIEVCNLGAMAYQTYLFDSIDNKGNGCVKDGRRAEMLVNVLETEMPSNGSPLQIPGFIPQSLGKEYAIIKALDPKRWEGYSGSSDEKADEEDITEILKTTLGTVENEIRDKLELVCISRFEPQKTRTLRLKEWEKEYFGHNFEDFYKLWEESFLKTPLPKSIKEYLKTIRSPRQQDKVETSLRLFVERQFDPVRSLSDLERVISCNTDDLYNVRDDIINAYARLHLNSETRLLKIWAENCLEEMKKNKEQVLEEYRLITEFSEMQRVEENRLARRWEGINYLGPVMSVDAQSRQLYTSKVLSSMRIKTNNMFRQLIEFVTDKITDDNYPDLTQTVKLLCKVNLSTDPDHHSFVIDRGLDKGKKITFTDVAAFPMISLLIECDELKDLIIEER